MGDKDKILIKIQLNDDGTTATLKNFEDKVINSKVAIDKLSNSIGNFTVAKGRMDAGVKITGKQLDRLKKNVDGFKNSTGAASSAAMELGRIVSDAPYGIRGMANNVSQLASQLTYMAASTDIATGKAFGFRSAVKGVIGSLNGPLGALLAFQAVVSAIDFFAGSTKKAEDNLEGLNTELDKTLDKINVFSGELPDSLADMLSTFGISNKQFEEFGKNMNEVLKILNNEFPEFKKAYDKLSETQKQDPKTVSNLIDKYKELINVRKGINKTEEKIALIRKDSELNTESNLRTQRKIYRNLILQKIELEEIFKKEKKRGKERSKKSVSINPYDTDDLKLRIKDFTSAMDKADKDIEYQQLKNNEKLALISAKGEEDKLRIKEEFRKKRIALDVEYNRKAIMNMIASERKSLESQLDNITKNENKKLEKYKQSVNKKKGVDASEKARLIKDAEIKSREVVQKASKSLKEALDALPEKERLLLEKMLGLANLRGESFSGPRSEGTPNLFGFDEKTLADVEASIKLFKTAYSGINDFMNSEFDRQMTIEQNKTNALNEELNNRLLNEQLSNEQRKDIQKQIWQNDENLRKKQEQIAKKKFQTNKAFNIAMAVTDTYLAANQVLKDPALTGQPWARIPMAVATIASGLANVASIARQKFQSSSAATPVRTGSLGGADGGNDRSFNFNLAGQTQGNQILDALNQQFENPVKAYVVSRDMTTAQELDSNIRNTASF